MHISSVEDSPDNFAKTHEKSFPALVEDKVYVWTLGLLVEERTVKLSDMSETTDIYRTVIIVGLVLMNLLSRSYLETSGELKTNCPASAREGVDLTRECFVSNTDFNANITWNVPADGSLLTVQKVRRENNGKNYTCNGEWGSPPSRDSVTYTLYVAFGPDYVTMSSNTTGPLVTDGTVQVALSCHAVNVHPAANYTWTDVTCVNKYHTNGTCMFTPRVPEDDNRQVSCTAHNVLFSSLNKSNHIKLILTYPPTSPPEITREKSTLTCTVRGGNPKVSSVTFLCGNESNRPGVVDDFSVSSSVVINVHQQDSHVTCECSATWDPQPGLYPHKVVIPLYLSDSGSVSSHKDKPQLLIPVAAGAASVVLVLIIVVVVACFIKTKQTRPTEKHGTSNHHSRQHDELDEQVNMVYVSADIPSLS